MERNRENRRASIVGSNGFNRRRPRTNSHRDSPDEDGGVEFPESVRLRDRVKKDQDRDRERERERDRERERSSRSKRRRPERLMNNREDGGDDSSEESTDDDDVYEDEENITTTSTTTIGGGVRPAAAASGFISIPHHHGHHSNHHHSHSQQHNISSNNNISNNHHLQHRKSFPPASSSSSKVFKVTPVWKAGDEMIGVSVPRKARSASTKRSHDGVSSSSNNNGGVAGGEQILRQASTSPARQGLASTSVPSPSAPMSPSSSNVSNRKKLKLGNNNGQKLKPPKVSSKSSSNPEDLEIEIAEVLYGLKTHSQGPTSKKEDSRDVSRSSIDGKSQVSSPISNSTSANNPILPPTSSPLSVVAPKRKRPRQVLENPNYGVRSSPSSTDQKPKIETSSPNLEKIPGSAAENGYDMSNLVSSQGVAVQPLEPVLPEAVMVGSESKTVAEESRESRDSATKEEVSSPEKKEYPLRVEGNNPEDLTATASFSSPGIKLNLMLSGGGSPREPKFEIDLMAPPPQVKLSSDTDAKIELRADQKPVLSSVDADMKPVMVSEKEEEKMKSRKDDSSNVGVEDKKGKGRAEEDKKIEIKGGNTGFQLDIEKPERDGNAVTVNKLNQQLPTKATREEPQAEKYGQSTSSLTLPVSMASWPGELPPMGRYMAPLQGIVSMDGNAVTPASIQPLFSQPRPKRCATHCYIAQNIHYLQQLAKMNPFWPGSASLFGTKPCNLNVVPSADLLGNMAVGGVNNALDKRQGLANIPSHNGKEKGSQPPNASDSAQRKQQILLQQALPPVAPNNMLGPAFIFPLNQQHAAVAVASARPTTAKPPTMGSVASSNISNSAAASASATAGGAPTAMSFNYPNMPPSEYLTILQNNAYPFPIPAMAGPTNYRGPPSQAMPVFNGSFYSSQMIHPSQIQLQQPPVSLAHQMQAHQNASSSSSQKHLQSLHSRPHGSSANGGSGSENLQNFQTQRFQSSQLPQSQNHHINPPRARHLENELRGDDSPSAADNRGARASMNIYGQNFSMQIHPQNFALMTPSAALTGTASSGSGNQSEKKQQQSQQQGLKTGIESQPSQTFPMSFGLINGTTAGPVIDMTSMSQNHAIFQSFPEARQNIQMMAAAATAQKKNFRISEDGKSGGGDSSATDDERKGLAGKSEAGVGQSIVFTRTDIADASVSSRTSRPATSNNLGAINPNAHIQAQFQQQQQLSATLGARGKAPSTTSGNIYSEHLNSSSSTVAKFPNTLSAYPQNLVQNSNVSSPAQSPQWRSSGRTLTSQAPLASSTASSVKNLPQQQSRTQQMHTQISFGGNQKPAAASQVQPPASSSNQGPSSPMMVGSPTTSSISKGPSGSPRNTGASTSSKTGQASSLSTQSAKNSQAVPSQKSPSILGNPHVISSSNSGTKPQMQQQSQQQQLPKNMPQTQLFFSHPYSQAQSPHSTSMSSTTSGSSGYYMPRRRAQQHQQPTQHPPGAPVTSSAAMLSLCTGTNDPAKAIAAATCNVKGGGLPAQGLIHAAQFAAQSGNIVPGFSYVHTVPAAVPVKRVEQKQPAGNDNLHPWQPEKK